MISQLSFPLVVPSLTLMSTLFPPFLFTVFNHRIAIPTMEWFAKTGLTSGGWGRYSDNPAKITLQSASLSHFNHFNIINFANILHKEALPNSDFFEEKKNPHLKCSNNPRKAWLLIGPFNIFH